jgi:hypothetical protein
MHKSLFTESRVLICLTAAQVILTAIMVVMLV